LEHERDEVKSMSLGPSEFGGEEDTSLWPGLGASELTSEKLKTVYSTNAADENSGATIVTERVV
jgi:hypothetical protein